MGSLTIDVDPSVCTWSYTNRGRQSTVSSGIKTVGSISYYWVSQSGVGGTSSYPYSQFTCTIPSSLISSIPSGSTITGISFNIYLFKASDTYSYSIATTNFKIYPTYTAESVNGCITVGAIINGNTYYNTAPRSYESSTGKYYYQYSSHTGSITGLSESKPSSITLRVTIPDFTTSYSSLYCTQMWMGRTLTITYTDPCTPSVDYVKINGTNYTSGGVRYIDGNSISLKFTSSFTTCSHSYGIFRVNSSGYWEQISLDSGGYYIPLALSDTLRAFVYDGNPNTGSIYATSGYIYLYTFTTGNFYVNSTKITSDYQSVVSTLKDDSGYYINVSNTSISKPTGTLGYMVSSNGSSWTDKGTSTKLYFTSNPMYVKSYISVDGVVITYSKIATVSYNACKPEITSHTISYGDKTETSSTTLTDIAPNKLGTFNITYECSSSCGYPTCTYTTSWGASGSGSSSSCTVNYTPVSGGYFYVYYTLAGCDGGTTVSYTQCIRIYPEEISLTMNGDVISRGTSTATYTIQYPRDVVCEFTDTYASTVLPLYIHKGDTQLAIGYTSPLTHTISAQDLINWGGAGTYRLFFRQKESLLYTVDLTLQDKTSHAYVNGTEVSSGEVKQIITTTAINVTFQYTNTYGQYMSIRILVDGTEKVVQSSSSVSTTITFSEGGQHVIRCEYGNETQGYFIDIEYTVSIVGIITGDGYLTLNGSQITDTQSVAQYFSNAMTLEGLSGMDSGTTINWLMESGPSTSDYELTYSGLSATFMAKSVGVNYRIYCYVYSYGVLAKTVRMPTGKYLYCTAKTVAGFSIDKHEGEPGLEFTCYDGFAIAPTSTGSVTVNYKWYIKNSLGVVTTDYVTVSGGGTSDDNWVFKMNTAGTYTIILEADPTGTSYASYEHGTYSQEIVINNIDIVSLPFEKRMCIGFYNKNKCGLALRDTGDVIYQKLKFASGLNTIGLCSFDLIGANNFGENESILCSPGTTIIIYDNLCPIWSGILTEIQDINVNYYDRLVNTKVYSIKCQESSYELSLSYIPQTSSGTHTGKVDELAALVIPAEHKGVVSSSTVNYGVSLETSSRLTALDSMSSQLGWRYRVRQKVGVFNKYGYSSGAYFRPSVLVDVGDILIVYGLGRYYTGIVKEVKTTNRRVTWESVYPEIPAMEDMQFTSYKGYLIDYRPSYYQEMAAAEYEINRYATNVSAVSNTTDRFGEVTVYGVGYSGEMLASTMKGWMDIKTNRTIPSSAKISTSYDCCIDSISRGPDVYVSDYTWSKFNVTVNGWSFPYPIVSNNHLPRIYYTRNDNVVDYVILRDTSGSIGSITRTKDQSGTKKTTFIIAFVKDYKGNPINPGEPYYDQYKNEKGQLLIDIFSSFTPMTNIIFDHCFVTCDDLITRILPGANSRVRIGDMAVTLKQNPSLTGELIYDWILPSTLNTNPIPHGHLNDVLVIDDSGTKYPGGYSYTSPHPDSPKSKYPEISKTVQGGEGYSMMEMEKLACRYLQYGSNYSEQGEADIVYNFFIKSDYDIGCKRTLQPGDRIVFQKVVEDTSVMVSYQNYNFELLSYSYDTTKNNVEITFGMPLVEIGGVIYNLQSNAGLSIVPADSPTTTTEE